ncbi:MAG TPA: response regulator transcription factor [Longimicrobiales bacterium]|nr:response regulator transcription factor [Longimicrobiales bacterium]
MQLGEPDLRAASMIKVAVVEDNRLLREGLTGKLNEQPDFMVCYAAANGSIEGLRGAASQVLLLDVGLEGEDSLNLAERVRTELPSVRVIIMDLLPVHEDLVEYVTAGVSGFILKDATLEDLVSTIRSVAAGKIILPAEMTSTLFSQMVGEAVVRGVEDVTAATDLTAREREVVNLIADGLSNKAIARHLDISPHTVKSHVRNVMDKLALHSRLQIASYLHKVSEHPDEE